MRHYKIERICWCEKTFNGYTDNPYWLINFQIYQIGLTDDGKFWNINNDQKFDKEYIRECLVEIIIECKLNIQLVC